MKRIVALLGSLAVALISIVAMSAVPSIAADASDLVTLVPARLFDSRTDPTSNTIDGLQLGSGPLAAGTETRIQIHDRANIPNTATAAIINITSINAQQLGFITAYPCGTPRPNASTLNFTPIPQPGTTALGVNIANGAIIPIGTAGKICIYTSATTNLALDITGYTPSDTDLVTLVPARLFDSRTDPTSNTIDGLQLGSGPLAAGTETQIQIHDRANIPNTATAAIINITSINAQQLGFITAYPCGTPRPNASTLNFTPIPQPGTTALGVNIANGAIIPIGTAGKICIYTSATTNLALDITGYTPSDTDLVTLVPARLFDSRTDPTSNTIDGLQLGSGPLAAGTETQIQIHDRANIPNTATAAIINITSINAQQLGFITAYPCGTPRPNASTLNFTPIPQPGTTALGVNIANGAIIPIGTAGKICIYTSATTNLALDITGYTRDTSGVIPTTTTILSPETSPATAREVVNAGFQRWCETGAGLVRCTRFVPDQDDLTETIAGFEGASAVGVGLSSVCAQFPTGDVRCFGNNVHGQLGDGSTTDSTTPVAVLGIGNARDVDAGLTNFACAALRTGRVACWGYNAEGQLGDGTTTNSPTPVLVSGIDNAVAVSAGGTFACALLADRTVRCWGTGRLGNGLESRAATAVKVLGLARVTMLSVGFGHACAALEDNSVACWGEGGSGQIGDGTRNPTALTNLTSGLTDVVAVAAGDAHTCARRANGQVACWGENDRGQTGAPPADDVLLPRTDPNVVNAIGIAAGVRFAVTVSS